MDRKSILILVLIIVCVSCHKNYYYSSSKIGGVRPKIPRFRLAKPEPYQLKPEDQIDTMAIYIRKYPDLLDKTKEAQSSYRFFSNGRFVNITESRTVYKYKLHRIGYYRVQNSNIILMESFIKASPAAGDLGKYHQSIGIIKNDTLVIVSGVRKFTDIKWEEKKISEYYHTPRIYLKQKVDTLIGTPDW